MAKIKKENLNNNEIRSEIVDLELKKTVCSVCKKEFEYLSTPIKVCSLKCAEKFISK